MVLMSPNACECISASQMLPRKVEASIGACALFYFFSCKTAVEPSNLLEVSNLFYLIFYGVLCIHFQVVLLYLVLQFCCVWCV
jgi:uncharacterized membrane protein